MTIDSSGISMLAKSLFVEKEGAAEKLQAWLAKEPPSPVDNRRETPPPGLAGPVGHRGPFRVNLSEEALALLAGLPGKLDNNEEVENNEGVENKVDADTYNRLHMLKFLVEAMTGKKIKFKDADKKDGDDMEVEGAGHAEDADEAGEATRSIEYSYSEYRFEQEVLMFEASGVINTAGGGETSFTIKFSMTRTYYSARTFDFVAGQGGSWAGTDPLVSATSSSGTAFSALGSIDTDSGVTGPEAGNDVAMLPGYGSGTGGLLVYDRNSNGVVDSSSELFGTGDGNGFSELAVHDEDANNWINEDDPIYKRLYVRVVGPDGEERLIPLKEAGIGAIYLDYADMKFALKDGANSLDGQVVRTGVYVNDNGRVGTVQQVNVVA